MKKTYAGFVIGILVFLSACSVQNIEAQPCTTELSPVVTPSNINLYPEETVQPSFKVFSCGGDVELQVSPRWVSADPNIATVDETTGLITAQFLGGSTDITVSEAEYGTEAVVRVSVPVVDPVP